MIKHAFSFTDPSMGGRLEVAQVLTTTPENATYGVVTESGRSLTVSALVTGSQLGYDYGDKVVILFVVGSLPLIIGKVPTFTPNAAPAQNLPWDVETDRINRLITRDGSQLLSFAEADEDGFLADVIEPGDTVMTSKGTVSVNDRAAVVLKRFGAVILRAGVNAYLYLTKTTGEFFASVKKITWQIPYRFREITEAISTGAVTRTRRILRIVAPQKDLSVKVTDVEIGDIVGTAFTTEHGYVIQTGGTRVEIDHRGAVRIDTGACGVRVGQQAVVNTSKPVADAPVTINNAPVVDPAIVLFNNDTKIGITNTGATVEVGAVKFVMGPTGISMVAPDVDIVSTGKINLAATAAVTINGSTINLNTV